MDKHCIVCGELVTVGTPRYRFGFAVAPRRPRFTCGDRCRKKLSRNPIAFRDNLRAQFETWQWPEWAR